MDSAAVPLSSLCRFITSKVSSGKGKSCGLTAETGTSALLSRSEIPNVTEEKDGVDWNLGMTRGVFNRPGLTVSDLPVVGVQLVPLQIGCAIVPPRPHLGSDESA